MDYFLMNEYVFKLIIKNKKKFIINLLESLNIKIFDYNLFELPLKNSNTKIDIILISKNIIINFELNKSNISLNRNRIFFQTLKSILPQYQIIQININLFKTHNYNKNILNYTTSYNEYINFVTCKNYQKFKTDSLSILEVIEFLKHLDINLLKPLMLKEEKIKSKLDLLFFKN